MERWQQFILDWIRDPADRAGARRDLEALFVSFAESIVMSRCQGPGDILVVEDWGTAVDIAEKAKNPCHNHQILIRADYERAVREAEDRVWEEAAKIADGWANSRSCKAHDDNPCCHVRTGAGIASALRSKKSNPEPREGEGRRP